MVVVVVGVVVGAEGKDTSSPLPGIILLRHETMLANAGLVDGSLSQQRAISSQ